jgi:L-cysteine desulfidase
MKKFMVETEVKIEHIKSGFTFGIIVTLYKDSSYSKVRIANYHTNIVLIEKDGNILKQLSVTACTCRGSSFLMATASLPKVWSPHLKMLVDWGKRV